MLKRREHWRSSSRTSSLVEAKLSICSIEQVDEFSTLRESVETCCPCLSYFAQDASWSWQLFWSGSKDLPVDPEPIPCSLQCAGFYFRHGIGLAQLHDNHEEWHLWNKNSFTKFLHKKSLPLYNEQLINPSSPTTMG